MAARLRRTIRFWKDHGCPPVEGYTEPEIVSETDLCLYEVRVRESAGSDLRELLDLIDTYRRWLREHNRKVPV